MRLWNITQTATHAAGILDFNLVLKSKHWDIGRAQKEAIFQKEKSKQTPSLLTKKYQCTDGVNKTQTFQVHVGSEHYSLSPCLPRALHVLKKQ